jgi:3-oxoacyl-[acyl-carrier protein] reductase
MKLENRTAIVTGGGRGIGREISLALADKRANVVVAARTLSEIEKTRDEIISRGGNAIAVQADVTEEKQVRHLIDETLKQYGAIDILVNNAGVAVRKSVAETSLDEYDNVMDVNLKGMFLSTKYAIALMSKQKDSIIINISSGAGKTGFAGLAVYSASKFAVLGFTEALAGEVQGKVYAVCPGGVNTGMYSGLFGARGGLEPEYVASRIVGLCEKENIASGSSLDVFS